MGDELMQKDRWARVLAVWHTDLPRPVLVLQGGTALSFFGTGLILPFEIIYLHAVRGFSSATAGLVVGTVMATGAVVTLPAGSLLDRFSAKSLLIAGNLVNAVGYGGLAFVHHPWQGFVFSAIGGAGFGFVATASQVLTLTLVPPEQRATSTAMRRVSANFGTGLGATIAGFVVAAAHHHLYAFQGLYVFDMLTFAVFALVVLVGVPNPGVTSAASATPSGHGFRAVRRDRLLWALIAGNFLQVMIGGSFFQSVLPPFATEHSPVGAGEIGVVLFINTFFVVVAQLPATRVVARMRRTHALFATSATFALGLLTVLLATLTSSTLAATAVLAGVAIIIAVAECAQFIVLGPLIAEIAPPHLLGRYMSLYQLSFLTGIALGPAVGGVLLGTSADTIWWGGALALALTAAGFLRLGSRIPDPLLPTKSSPLQAAPEAT
jgi:MFS family permease